MGENVELKKKRTRESLPRRYLENLYLHAWLTRGGLYDNVKNFLINGCPKLSLIPVSKLRLLVEGAYQNEIPEGQTFKQFVLEQGPRTPDYMSF
jgi:hypothetical protein